METQKVEIEIPVFDGMEFLRIGILSRSEAEDADIKVCSVIHQKNGRYSYGGLADPEYYIGLINIIYRKKRQRRIIYEEVREDHLKRGDFYRDDDGDVNMWISDMQSREKHTIIKKVHDDFEVNNG